MQDYELSILEQYPIIVKSTRKTRGAFFCDTNQGFLLLREAGMSKRRVLAMQELCSHLEEEGYARTDQLIPNELGEFVSTSEEGRNYILKRWFRGRECDIRKGKELLEGTSNLAHLHRFMTGIPGGENAAKCEIQDEYARHNQQLKKIRKFMRNQSPLGEFEMEFLKSFDKIFQWAEAAFEEAKRMPGDKIFQDCVDRGIMIHGDYNYHNILMTDEGIATTNFDKSGYHIQAEDIYYFLRKAMEKQGWNIRAGGHMLDAYNAIRPLTKEEESYLKLRLVYPEKFWKLADAYYRSNKAWISVKNVEKLKIAIRQIEEKRQFLEAVFSFRLG